MKLTHSYSSVKDFHGCARRYYHVKILKQFKSQQTEATLYGTAVHSAFEEYLTHGTPIPAQFSQFEPFVKPLASFPGKIICEQKMAIRNDFSTCDFFDDAVWFRGIPDYVALDEAKGVARVGDFKTGKSSRYADTDQLELMAAMVMAHYPTINKVKGALLFVVPGDIIKADFTREQLPAIWSKWAGYAGEIESNLENGVWNARPSGLCKFCPLSEQACEHR